MKLRYSVSLKLTIIIISVSAIAIASIPIINIIIQTEETPILEAHYDKAAALVYALNESIGTPDQLENRENLTIVIEKFIDWNERILRLNINIPDDQGTLFIFASSDNNSIGSITDSHIVDGVSYTNRCYNEGHTFYIPHSSGDTNSLVIISPINLSGTILGTYEIISSMDAAFEYIETTEYNRAMVILLTCVAVLFALLFGFLFLLRRVIVNPIMKFRDTAKVFGKGDLDARVHIKSKDELGDLASAFNQMAKDLKESRDKIQDYNQILENLLHQKDEFIGQLGHDLKNPLQPLVGLLPMLIEQEKDPGIKEGLEIMNKNVEYMRDLIFETLQLAKLRSSDIKFNFEKLNLKQELDNVIASQKLMLIENKIDIDDKISNDLFVKADKLRLSEVFKNLITNSVKYTSEGEGKITIDAKKEKNVVTVSLKDTGIGMTKDQLKKVFDEFYKVDRTSSEHKSSGLGLSICKRIIDKHEGKIWVESPGPGKGSTFYFTLKSEDEK